MLYVEKDLSAIVKAVFEAWPERKDELAWKYLHASDARLTPSDVIRAAEKGELLRTKAAKPRRRLAKTAL
jgi:hypothetical protein